MKQQSILRQITYRAIHITEVETKTGFIQGIDNALNVYTISWYLHGPVAIAPQVGDRWVIRKQDNSWELVARYDDSTQIVPLNALLPGDRRLEGSGIVYIAGKKVDLRGSTTLDKDLTVGEGLSVGAAGNSYLNLKGTLSIRDFDDPQKRIDVHYDTDTDCGVIDIWTDSADSLEDHADLLPVAEAVARNIVIARNGGMVGIGKEPEYTLDVEGDVNVTGSYYIDGVPLTSGLGGDLNYTFSQLVPSTSWSITHNLGKFPSVTVVDSAGNVIVGNIQYQNINQLTITFSAGFSGTAYLN